MSNQKDFIGEIEAGLKPGGSQALIKLQLDSSNLYFQEQFVNDCLSCLKKRLNDIVLQKKLMGSDKSLNELERLGILLLADSAGVTFPSEQMRS